MSNEQIKRIIEDSYDESKEEGLRSIARDFYNRKLLSSVILVWIVGIVFVGLAVYSARQFFQTDQTKWQLVYAALFIVGVHEVSVIKIFAWQMAHRHNLKRDISVIYNAVSGTEVFGCCSDRSGVHTGYRVLTPI